MSGPDVHLPLGPSGKEHQQEPSDHQHRRVVSRSTQDIRIFQHLRHASRSGQDMLPNGHMSQRTLKTESVTEVVRDSMWCLINTKKYEQEVEHKPNLSCRSGSTTHEPCAYTPTTSNNDPVGGTGSCCRLICYSLPHQN